MNCPQCQDLLAGYVEGLLDGTVTSQVEAHLANCPGCRLELDETRPLFDRLMADGRAASAISLDTQIMDRIVHEQALQLRRIPMKRMIRRIAIAAAALIVVGVGIAYLTTTRDGSSAYAEEVAAARRQLEEAETITWKMIGYQRVTSRDGKRQWLDVTNYEFAHKRPGLQRKTTIKDGQVVSISIEDRIHGKELLMLPKRKEAHLYYYPRPTSEFIQKHIRPGPFNSILEMLGTAETEWLRTKKINGRQANGFRITEGKFSADLWIDADTKDLVSMRAPSVVDYDPEKDPARNNPPEEEASLWEGSTYIKYDIVFDSPLDDSLFSFDAPEGYSLEEHRIRAWPKPTEESLIEWLRVYTEYHGGVFPGRVLEWGLSLEEVNILLKTEEEDRSPAAQRLWLRFQQIDPGPPKPVYGFAKQAGDSWMYLGKGVKLGDETAIVCWYKPKDSKTYRVVYGDLSVRDVTAEDLPLKAEP